MLLKNRGSSSSKTSVKSREEQLYDKIHSFRNFNNSIQSHESQISNFKIVYNFRNYLYNPIGERERERERCC